MTKAIKHTVPGAIGERRSPRVYTHAVVAQWDYAAESMRATKKAHDDVKLNWSYNKILQDAIEGENYGKYQAGYNFPIDAKMIEGARAYFAKYGQDFHRAVAKRLDEIKADIDKRRAANGSSNIYVLQWSMSEANAAKACGTWAKRGYMNVTVFKTVRHDVIRVRATGAAVMKGSR